MAPVGLDLIGVQLAIPAGQPAPLWRFPQPPSRCARRGRPKILSAAASPTPCRGQLGSRAGKHLGRPGRPVMRAPSSRRLVPARREAISPPGPGIRCCLAGSPTSWPTRSWATSSAAALGSGLHRAGDDSRSPTCVRPGQMRLLGSTHAHFVGMGTPGACSWPEPRTSICGLADRRLRSTRPLASTRCRDVVVSGG